MGIFKKMKDGVQAAADAAQLTQDHATVAPQAGQIGVQGMPVNPAAFGGPSTNALDANDPLLQPVDGIGLPEYAAVVREAQARGATSEEEMGAIAAELGHDPATFIAASQEWVRRMGQSMVVGQEFRRHLGI